MSDSRLDLVHRFFHGTGATYDRIVNLATLGCDARWKRRILEMIPEGAARIVDQACGTGILTFGIARKFPQARIIGVDIEEEYLHLARAKAAGLGWAHVEFLLGRAEEVFVEGEIDCITSSYLAKYADLPLLMGNIGRMLRPGGRLIMHDFTYPQNCLFAALWELYLLLLRAGGALFYPEWRNALRELPHFLRETKWVPGLLGILRQNAFKNIQVQSLTLGTSAIVSAEKI